MTNQGTSDRGFGGMDEDKQREIARKGGQSVPDEKRSFSQDRELAAEAGREGGQQSQGDDRRGGSQQGEDRRGGSQQGDDDQRSGQQNQDDRGQSRDQQGGGNFADDPERAREAGRKGGQS